MNRVTARLSDTEPCRFCVAGDFERDQGDRFSVPLSLLNLISIQALLNLMKRSKELVLNLSSLLRSYGLHIMFSKAYIGI